MSFLLSLNINEPFTVDYPDVVVNYLYNLLLYYDDNT